ncbi:type II toxin-antitoxin system RelB/DinJ family antitoxin [bacterium]|nr:type II toxin-antitoxin system RelB/DinJ family antitoxin [bacterium]MBT3730327.1 type II toxin-antitoxin system RelB/DinJ family antitoxin [bacterium]MBT4894498.1 type II toxin-antitoxin system RelB/DinJ family antitoxin [bacterium]
MSNTQTILNIKTDKKLKENAKKVAGKIGVPLSTVVNSFLKQFVRDEEVTFSSKSYQMTPYLESLVEEARRDRRAGKTSGPFSNAKDLMKHLNS